MVRLAGERSMLTIAWDVDDVLNNLMGEWLTKKWLPEHPGCRITFAEIKQNPPEVILGCSRAEYEASLDEFRLSTLYPAMLPDKDVLAWFKKNGSRARHLALTAVPLKAAHISAAWVLKYFGSWIRTFSFVPSVRLGEEVVLYDRSKAGYLKWLDRVDVLVEDSEPNINAVRAIGLPGFLVNKPWNKGGVPLKEALAKIL